MICVFYVWLPGQYRRQLPSASLSVSDMTMMKNVDDVRASDDDSDEDSDDNDDNVRMIMIAGREIDLSAAKLGRD